MFDLGIAAIRTYRNSPEITIYTWDGDLGKTEEENLEPSEWIEINGFWLLIGPNPREKQVMFDLGIEEMFIMPSADPFAESTTYRVEFRCGCEAIADYICHQEAGWIYGLYICTTMCHVGCVYSYAISEAYKYA